MDKIVAYCGMICSECLGYIATQNDDWEERRRVAEMWSKIFGVEITPEYVNCDGCTAGGKLIEYAKTCEIRICALSKDVKNCAYCDDYPCEKLERWFERNPKAKEVLDDIRASI